MCVPTPYLTFCVTDLQRRGNDSVTERDVASTASDGIPRHYHVWCLMRALGWQTEHKAGSAAGHVYSTQISSQKARILACDG